MMETKENKLILGIDQGHSLSGPGTGASSILSEVEENRKIGKALIKMLEEKGHTVINCTVDYASSENEQLLSVVAKANAQDLDWFISIHLNSGGGYGTETYVHPVAAKTTRDKAKAINEEIYKSCNFKNRGVKEANFQVLRETKASAMLLEICFVDSQEDARKINTEKVAKAIFKGITGVEYVETTPDKTIYYRVVCGSYSSRENALKRKEVLEQAGFKPFLVATQVGGSIFFRVICGSYTNRDNAEAQLKLLKEKGFTDAFIAAEEV